MTVGDTIDTVYGAGGFDPAGTSGNLIERHVITVETATERTVEVRDGAGVVRRTYTVSRNMDAENAVTLEQRLDQGEDELRRYLALTDTQAATSANIVRVLRIQCRVLLAMLRLRRNRLEATD